MYTNVIHVPITIEMNMVIENRDGAEVFFLAETKKFLLGLFTDLLPFGK